MAVSLQIGYLRNHTRYRTGIFFHSIEAEIFYRTIKDSNRFSLKFSTLYHEKQRYTKSRFFKILEKGTADEDL